MCILAANLATFQSAKVSYSRLVILNSLFILFVCLLEVLPVHMVLATEAKTHPPYIYKVQKYGREKLNVNALSADNKSYIPIFQNKPTSTLPTTIL